MESERLRFKLGIGDRTTLGIFTTGKTDEQQVLQAGEEISMGGDGLDVGTDGKYARNRTAHGQTTDLCRRTFSARAGSRDASERPDNEEVRTWRGIGMLKEI